MKVAFFFLVTLIASATAGSKHHKHRHHGCKDRIPDLCPGLNVSDKGAVYECLVDQEDNMKQPTFCHHFLRRLKKQLKPAQVSSSVRCHFLPAECREALRLPQSNFCLSPKNRKECSTEVISNAHPCRHDFKVFCPNVDQEDQAAVEACLGSRHRCSRLTARCLKSQRSSNPAFCGGALSIGRPSRHSNETSKKVGKNKRSHGVSVTSVSPSTGSTNGGIWVEIRGEGFVSGDYLQVAYGDKLLMCDYSDGAYDDTYLACQLPRLFIADGLSAGTEVVLWLDVMTAITWEDPETGEEYEEWSWGDCGTACEFTAITPESAWDTWKPTVTDVWPTSGSAEGGTVVTITGRDLFPEFVPEDHYIYLGLQVGGKECQVLWDTWEENSLRCVTQSVRRDEIVDGAFSGDGVQIIFEDVDVNRQWIYTHGDGCCEFSYKFSADYTGEPVITQVLPEAVDVAGGTVMTVIGRNFAVGPNVRVVFGYLTGCDLSSGSNSTHIFCILRRVEKVYSASHLSRDLFVKVFGVVKSKAICKIGDNVVAVWQGNGQTYGATIAGIDGDLITVNWDDADPTHRGVPSFDVFGSNGESCSTSEVGQDEWAECGPSSEPPCNIRFESKLPYVTGVSPKALPETGGLLTITGDNFELESKSTSSAFVTVGAKNPHNCQVQQRSSTVIVCYFDPSPYDDTYVGWPLVSVAVRNTDTGVNHYAPCLYDNSDFSLPIAEWFDWCTVRYPRETKTFPAALVKEISFDAYGDEIIVKGENLEAPDGTPTLLVGVDLLELDCEFTTSEGSLEQLICGREQNLANMLHDDFAEATELRLSATLMLIRANDPDSWFWGTLDILVPCSEGCYVTITRPMGWADAAWSAGRTREHTFYANEAYSETVAQNRWLPPNDSKFIPDPEFQLTSTTVVSDMDLLAFMGVSLQKQEIIVSFRGTNSAMNGVEDLAFIPVVLSAFPLVFVHGGFFASWTALEYDVRTNLQDLLVQYPRFSLTITGHSLGGALAVLCAHQLRDLVDRGIYLQTFGTPRVGNSNFAREVRDHPNIIASYRVVNKWDPVPLVPPMFLGFHHTAQEIWFGYDNGLNMCNLGGEDPHCCNQGWSWNNVKFWWLHKLENYQNSIDAVIKLIKP